MRYLGGKARLRDDICAVINQIDASIYLEPFCGVCWVGEKVNMPNRILTDANYYLIEMWKALQGGWIPPNKAPTEEEYKRIRDDSSVAPELKGFIGIAQSYGGKWWGGYARGTYNNGSVRDYTTNAYNQTMKRIVNLKSAVFKTSNYSRMLFNSLKIQKPMVIYLDPPYKNTATYAGMPPFDSELFWHNVKVVGDRHYVLVSSYEAPANYTLVREWFPKTGMNRGNNERLFSIGKLLEDYTL